MARPGRSFLQRNPGVDLCCCRKGQSNVLQRLLLRFVRGMALIMNYLCFATVIFEWIYLTSY